MTSGQQLMGDKSNLGGIERRTVVRAGAWSVPVVAVAASAPAFACSPDYEVSAFSAAYQNQGLATLRPDRLVVSATTENNGSRGHSGTSRSTCSSHAGLPASAPVNSTTTTCRLFSRLRSAGHLQPRSSLWADRSDLQVPAAIHSFRKPIPGAGPGNTLTLTAATIQLNVASNPPSPFKPFVGAHLHGQWRSERNQRSHVGDQDRLGCRVGDSSRCQRRLTVNNLPPGSGPQ